MTRRRATQIAAQVTAAGALAGAACVAYGWQVERNAFTLRELSVPVLTGAARELRVLHLSDLHLEPTRHKLVDWVRDLDRLEPDLVVATGDFLAGLDAVPTVLEALEPLLRRPGMFVPGNADYYAPRPKSPTRYFTRTLRHGQPLPWRELAEKMAASGWWDLTHVRTTVTVAGVGIDVRGVDDPHLRKDRYHRVAGAADPAADLRMALMHSPEPRLLNRMTEDGVDLLVAGHSHGGQIRLPVVGALTTNCGIDRGRARGLSDWRAEGNRSALHVSAGLGTNPYMPFRFCCRPEATLLTLTPKSG